MDTVQEVSIVSTKAKAIKQYAELKSSMVFQPVLSRLPFLGKDVKFSKSDGYLMVGIDGINGLLVSFSSESIVNLHRWASKVLEAVEGCRHLGVEALYESMGRLLKFELPSVGLPAFHLEGNNLVEVFDDITERLKGPAENAKVDRYILGFWVMLLHDRGKLQGLSRVDVVHDETGGYSEKCELLFRILPELYELMKDVMTNR